MDFRTWCRHFFPGGSFSDGGDQYSCKNHLRGEKHASLSFCRGKRAWNDFGTGEGGRISDFCREHDIPEWDGAPPKRETFAPSAPSSGGRGSVMKTWDRARPASEHPYLSAKGVDGSGCRVDGDVLLVPAFDTAGVLAGIERIGKDGAKKHLGAKSGAFFFCGAPDASKPLLLCEGMATAKSVHVLSGLPSACAFGAANMLKGAEALRGRCGEVVVCPDADGSGAKAANECRSAGIRVLETPRAAAGGTDWNDILLELGAEAAGEIFRNAWKGNGVAVEGASPSLFAEPGLPALSARSEGKSGLRTVTAKNLMQAVLREPVWAVDQLVPEGLSVLASPPKTGKSFLVLQMALAVASGSPFLGFRTTKGPVLYCALEDSLSRLSKRISLLADDERDVPENLYLLNEMRGLDGEGLPVLSEWMSLHKPRLVVVDTWGKAKPSGDSRKNAYERDVEIVSEVKRLADRHECSVLLVHHEKKGGSRENDWLESLSGSMGLTATVDGILSLKRGRGENRGVLRRSGRDFEEDSDLALTWKEPGWECLGDASEVLLSESRRRILQTVRDAGEPVSPSYITSSLGKNPSTTRVMLMKMTQSGLLVRTPSGNYALPNTETRAPGEETAVFDRSASCGEHPEDSVRTSGSRSAESAGDYAGTPLLAGTLLDGAAAYGGRANSPHLLSNGAYDPVSAAAWLARAPENVRREHESKLRRLRGLNLPDWEGIALRRTWEECVASA